MPFHVSNESLKSTRIEAITRESLFRFTLVSTFVSAICSLQTGNYPFRTRRETRRKFRNEEKEIARTLAAGDRVAELFRGGCGSNDTGRHKFAPKETKTTKKWKKHRGAAYGRAAEETHVFARMSAGDVCSRSATASSRLDQRVVLRFCQHSASPRFSLEKIEMLDDSRNTLKWTFEETESFFRDTKPYCWKMTPTRPPSHHHRSTAIPFATLRFYFAISFATVSSGSSPDFFWSDPEFLFPFWSRLVAAAQRSRQLRSWKRFLPFLGGVRSAGATYSRKRAGYRAKSSRFEFIRSRFEEPMAIGMDLFDQPIKISERESDIQGHRDTLEFLLPSKETFLPLPRIASDSSRNLLRKFSFHDPSSDHRFLYRQFVAKSLPAGDSFATSLERALEIKIALCYKYSLLFVRSEVEGTWRVWLDITRQRVKIT